MDGFAIGIYGEHYGYTQFGREEIPNYWTWAERYALSDHFFATVPGPSYPNHLAFVAGQTGGVIDNPENIRTLNQDDATFKSWGCDAVGEDVFVLVKDDKGNLAKHSTCFGMPTVGEQLSGQGIDWAYYAAAPDQYGYIWNAYSAFENVFGTELWGRHIRPVDRLLEDIRSDALPPVTWITPRFELSDHPPWSTGHAHNWVTDIVNGIMESPAWEHTAIFVTWDEWGGFYDHVAPPSVMGEPLGIRVPMLTISPYAKTGYVDDVVGDFTSPLAFISDNWGMPYLTDRIGATHNFKQVFDFSKPPRPPEPLPRSKRVDGDPFTWIGHSDEWPDFIDPVDDPL
jgi:phospholipase C